MSKQSRRDKLVLISSKLAKYSFFGMPIFAIVAKFLPPSLGVIPEYAIFLFCAALFFLGLTMIPTSYAKTSFSSWLMPVAFLTSSVGLCMIIGRLLLFHTTLQDPIVSYGAIVLIAGVVLMHAAAIMVNHSSTYRSTNDTSAIKEGFEKVAKTLNLSIKDVSVPLRFEMVAEGEISQNPLRLSVENDLEAPQKRFTFRLRKDSPKERVLMSTSMLLLRFVNENGGNMATVRTVNEAVEIKGFSTDGENMIRSFIDEKHLNYFNFGLVKSNDQIHIKVHLALEEEQAWLDFVQLMEVVLKTG